MITAGNLFFLCYLICLNSALLGLSLPRTTYNTSSPIGKISRYALFFGYFLLLFSLSINSDPLRFCPKDKFYNSSSRTGTTYRTNLEFLLSTLTSNATQPNGFYKFTVGNNPSNPFKDAVIYGLFLCRGDVSPDECQECVATASRDILRFCPEEKVATLWYDNCMLRYSNESIFSRLDTSFTWFMSNPNIVSDPALLNRILGDTMDQIATRAANDVSGKKIAVQEANFTALEKKIYALAQCTPDLSSWDCDTCLRDAISKLPSCCSNRQGGRVITFSCKVWYELHPFYNVLSPPPGSTEGTSTRKVLANVGAIFVAILLFVLATFLARRSRTAEYHVLEEPAGTIEIATMEPLKHDFKQIQAATYNFAIGNKIGQGGFGSVYRGTLPDGREIAVKRLSRSSTQGPEEFRNEIELLAKLQHKNLVQLLGFCSEGEEMLLIYEFVPNKSLDYYLFDPDMQASLDWSTRYKIIEGIARGLVYLHQDSRLRIIHRDLKASNVLLNENMDPKIADFGMARLVGEDEYEGKTRRRAGTLCYMAPEYVTHGIFSTKSDVFSFGVIVLEIVSGKKKSRFFLAHENGTDDLLSYAWRQWTEGTPLALLDPAIGNSYKTSEVILSIHVGLLCVQDDPRKRPTIASALLMLNGTSSRLPTPIASTAVENNQLNQKINLPPVDEGGDKKEAQSQNSDILDEVEDRRHFFRSMFKNPKRNRILPP